MEVLYQLSYPGRFGRPILEVVDRLALRHGGVEILEIDKVAWPARCPLHLAQVLRRADCDANA
jgi:hypothetical protein